MKRERTPELMDRPGADEGQLAKSLRDLRFVNLFLGGRFTAVRLVLRLARRVGERPVRVLDVGTGGADLPIALHRASERRGIPVRIMATDLHPTTLDLARRAVIDIPAIEVAPANALDLSYPDGAFHIVMCTTTLHHFGWEDAGRVLRELARVATHGVVVTDLARSAPALVGARLLAATLWRRHPITRHDGPASVRAAFTPEELAVLAADAIGPDCRIRRHPLFRLSLLYDRTRTRPAPTPQR